MKDYYQILNVPYSANSGDIRKAYSELVYKYHPDYNKHIDAKAQFITLQEAYEILIDDKKRMYYDSVFLRGSNATFSEFEKWVEEADYIGQKNAEQSSEFLLIRAYKARENVRRNVNKWFILIAGFAISVTCIVLLILSIISIVSGDKEFEFSVIISWVMLFAFGFLGYKTIHNEFARYIR